MDRLPPGVQLTAYRIIQEALTNVRRHAQASTVHETITSKGSVSIKVVDDGSGVTGEPGPGNGLVGMRERVAMPPDCGVI